MRWGVSSERGPRSRVGPCTWWWGERVYPQVRTLVAEPVRPRRVAAAAGEWRVGVARGRRPGTLIVTGWRAVLSHRDPRGGGGGGARPWRGECAAPGRAREQALRALQASGLRLRATGWPLEQAPGTGSPLHSPLRNARPELRQSVVTRDSRSLTGALGAFHRAPPPRCSNRHNTGGGGDSRLSPRTWGASCRPFLHGPWPQVSKGLLNPCCPPWAVLMVHSVPELGHFVFPLHTLLYFQAFSVFLLCPWSSEQCLVHTWQAL